MSKDSLCDLCRGELKLIEQVLPMLKIPVRNAEIEHFSRESVREEKLIYF